MFIRPGNSVLIFISLFFVLVSNSANSEESKGTVKGEAVVRGVVGWVVDGHIALGIGPGGKAVNVMLLGVPAVHAGPVKCGEDFIGPVQAFAQDVPIVRL